METLAVLEWCVAILPLLGFSFCFWSEGDSEAGDRKKKVRMGLIWGFGAAVANIVQLFVVYLPMDRFAKWNFIFFDSAVLGMVASFFALGLLRRFAEFEVRSIGTASVALTMLDMVVPLVLFAL
jgi:hypothetical protein